MSERIDRNNRRMIERRIQTAFVQERLIGLLVILELVVQRLDGDDPVEHHVPRLVDHADAARRELADKRKTACKTGTLVKQFRLLPFGRQTIRRHGVRNHHCRIQFTRFQRFLPHCALLELRIRICIPYRLFARLSSPRRAFFAEMETGGIRFFFAFSLSFSERGFILMKTTFFNCDLEKQYDKDTCGRCRRIRLRR